MFQADARPRIASKARLRYDAQTGKWLLLYPERGMELSESASDILRRCDGERTVLAIVAELVAEYDESPPEDVEKDVRAFLDLLAERGLVEPAP